MIEEHKEVMMNIELKAKKFAIKAHKGQFRKSELDKPMVIHPINAANILKEYNMDSNVIAATYLHDVVEDTKYTIDDIQKKFGSDIAILVSGATEIDKNLRGIPNIPNEYLPDYKLITRKAISPSEEEINNNPRSRSAKLRIVERI